MKNTYIADVNGVVSIEPDLSEYKVDHIPPGVWELSTFAEDEEVKLCLSKVGPRFTNIPEDLGEEVTGIVRTITDTYLSRMKTQPTGALFHGASGHGKTCTAEAICNMLLARDIPTILVREDAYRPSAIKQFAALGPCVVLIDEMEKIYGRQLDADVDGPQDDFLGLFSDTSMKHVLWLTTVNQIGHVNDLFLNRPGRFLFRIDFSSVNTAPSKSIFIEKTGLSGWKKDCLCLALSTHGDHDTVSADNLNTLVDTLESSDTPEEYFKMREYLNVRQANKTGLTLTYNPAAEDLSHVRYNPVDGMVTLFFPDSSEITTPLFDYGEKEPSPVAYVKHPEKDVGVQYLGRGFQQSTGTIQRWVSFWNGEKIAVKDLVSEKFNQR